MPRSLRRELRFLRVHALISSLVVVVLCTAAFRQGSAATRFDEITVGRINVVDANGALRLVISNQDRMHPGVIDGRTIDRARPVAGLLNSKVRLTLTVGADGNPRIEFLDDQGKVVNRLPQQQP